MEELVDVCSLSRAQEKIVVGLSPYPGGLSLEKLSQRCGIRDLNGLRRACRELEQNHGMLSAGYGAHGKHIWWLRGRLVLRDGWLCWTAQREEQQAPAAAQPGRPRENPADWNEIFFQMWENQPAGGPNQVREGSFPAALDENRAAGGKIPAGRGEKQTQMVEKSRSAPDLRAKLVEKTIQVVEKPITEESLLNQDLRSDSINLKSKDINTTKTQASRNFSDSHEAQNRLLLKKAEILFGKPVTWHANFSSAPPGEVLGWLAQAYQAWQEGRVERPWGLAYRGLLGELRQKLPDKKYRAEPRDFLPQEYLAACGEARADFWPTGRDEDEADELPEEPDPPEEPFEKAWRSATGLLEADMPRASFLRMVSGTRALGWDEAGGVFSVAAGDAEAASWLQERLALQAGRLLCGILNRQVVVKFAAG